MRLKHEYRLKFSKKDKMQYIGHLDLLRVFQRAIKRAGVPVAYSNGFNPHQILSFAIPLPVGMTSDSEFLDIDLINDMDTELIKNKLNEQLPCGIEIITARRVSEDEKNCAAALAAAVYEIELDGALEDIDEYLREIMSSTEILYEKITKKKTKTVNMRPLLYDVKNITKNGNTVLSITSAAGSAENLKPEHFVRYIYKLLGREFIPYRIKYNRLEMFKSGKNERFESL